MDPDVPLVVSQVNPDDLAWHEGIIANPNCSTMQLMPPLMALRDAVGIERIVVDTYQAVAGTGQKAIVELEEQVKAHAEGRAEGRQRLPARHRLQRPAAHRRLPGQRLHQGGVEGRHREPQDPAPAGPARLVHGRPRARLREPLRGGPRRDPRTRSPPDRGPRAVRGRPGRRGPGRPGEQRLPARDGGRRLGPGVCGPGAPGPVHPGQPRARLLGRVGQPAQGRGTNAVEIAEVLVERGWIRKGSERAAATASGGSPA